MKKKEKPFLTLGMATYDDYDGVYFSIQALKLYQDIEDVQLIVVDNNPGEKHGKAVKNLVDSWSTKFHSAKYIAFEESTGTTQTRQKVFDEADGEFVLCMDCHVLLDKDAIKNLKKYYKENPKDSNLNSGPLIMDDTESYCTHFDMKWRGGMWGIWSSVMLAPDGTKFCARKGEGEFIEYRNLDIDSKVLTHTEFSKEEFPEIRFNEYQIRLEELGYKHLGKDVKDPPFQIPAMGLGVFTCRKDAWLGFNPHMREFGGEEGYIHKKFELAGHKNMCLPFLRWNHRFNRINGLKYRASEYGKIRNYILGHKEIGLPLDGIYDNFIKLGKMTVADYNILIKNPVVYNPPDMVVKQEATKKKEIEAVKKPEGLPQPDGNLNLSELFDWTKTQNRDLNAHLDTLKEYAEKGDSVTEFTSRRESTVAFLAANIKKVTTYSKENNDKLIKKCLTSNSVMPKIEIQGRVDSTTHKINNTDLLFIDTEAKGDQLIEELELNAHNVNKFIVMHDTEAYGIKGADGGEGLAIGLHKWLNKNPDWFLCFHDKRQYGLSIISKDPKYYPEEPVIGLPPNLGTGSNLKKDLEWLNLANETSGCSCGRHAEKMDRLGSMWCSKNLDIIMDWLEKEYNKRKEAGEIKVLPFIKPAVKLLIRKAIKKAKKQEKDYVKDFNKKKELVSI